ncbi:MAG: translocation/assembly module TamB [Bacteroidales bacterium]|nr:translocation/assembly module TamB [Bacteroidales bacterium]
MNGKGIHITSKVIGGIFAFFMLCIIASHDKNIQKSISSAIARRIDKVIDGKLSFSSINISPYGSFILKDVLVLDPDPYTADTYGKGYATTDTLFYAGSLTASFNLAGLLEGKGLHLGRVKIKDGGLFIVTEPPFERGRMNNMSILIKPQPKDTSFIAQPGPDIFDIRRVNVSNFRFRLVNFAKEKNEKNEGKDFGIDFEDMDVTINLRALNLKFAGGRMSGTVEHLDAIEKSGYKVEDLSGHAISGLGKTEITDIRILDSVSDIRLKYVNFTFKNITYFRDFVNKVRLDAEFDRSTVGISSVNWFSRGSLNGNELVFDVIQGEAHGTINNLSVNDFRFTETLTGISGTATANVRNVVPDVNNLMLDARIPDCSFNSETISVFLTNWARKSGKETDLSRLAPGEDLTADIFCSGNINDLDIGAYLGNTGFGRLRFDGNVREACRKETDLSVSGRFFSDSLHLGKTLGSDALGRMNGTGSFSVVLSKPMKFSLDTLKIDDVNALDYHFHDISASGGLADNTVRGRVAVADTSLRTVVAGLFDLQPTDGGKRRLKLGAAIGYADLQAIGLTGEDTVSKLKANIDADLFRDGDFLYGNASISGFNVDYGEGFTEIGDIRMNTSADGEEQKMNIRSRFADIDYSSTGAINYFLEDLQNLTSRKYLPALTGKSPQRDSSWDYRVSMNFHDSRKLMNYILPELYIADSTSLQLSIRDGSVNAELRSPRLAYGTRFARNLLLKVSDDSTSIGTRLTMDELNTGGIVILNPHVSASAESDDVLVGIDYDNVNGGDSFGNFNVRAHFSRDEANGLVIKAQPIGSSFGSSTEVWTITNSPVTLKGKDFHFDNLRIENELQSIRFNGGYSQNSIDTLGIAVDKIDLGIIDQFLTERIGIRGITSGQAIVTSPASTDLSMIVNVRCDSLAVGKAEGGTFRITSFWDEDDKRIYAMVRNSIRGKDILTAEGDYKPDGKEFGASVEFNGFALAIAAPLLGKIFTETGGYLNGGMTMSGKVGSGLSVASRDLNLKDARLRLSSTGASYTLNGPIVVDSKGISLEKMEIRDDNNGRASLSGTVSYSKPARLGLDASATLRDLDVLDIPVGNGFSGHVKASGGLKVKGPINELNVDADLVTSNIGDVHVPLSGALSSNSNDLLTFTKPEVELDPFEQKLEEQSQKKDAKASSDFRAKGRIRLTPGITAFMEINKSSGNIITISGSGDVDLELRPRKNQFNLNGIYMIDRGNYHFVIPGILEKDFNIQNGSFVKFGGDASDTEMDITAIYETRTSLSTLLADSTVVASRRLVQCGLSISGKLSNPEIGFSVTVPDLDPTTKSKVDGALNTEDKVQKQFVALLLFGSFLPSEQSGVFNQNNILYSNIGEVVSSQINSIFQKLNIPVDIGLGYQETNSGNNAFDVAVSTQLFNNRVVVNGSVGNRKYNTGSAASNGDIVGDIDIEFKLDKEGRFRLSAFSHSADQNTSYLDNSQRNGIGASYQQEYNTFREFWHNLFRKRPKKDGSEEDFDQESFPETENVIIKIENDSGKTIPDTVDAR